MAGGLPLLLPEDGRFSLCWAKRSLILLARLLASFRDLKSSSLIGLGPAVGKSKDSKLDGVETDWLELTEDGVSDLVLEFSLDSMEVEGSIASVDASSDWRVRLSLFEEAPPDEEY